MFLSNLSLLSNVSQKLAIKNKPLLKQNYSSANKDLFLFTLFLE